MAESNTNSHVEEKKCKFCSHEAKYTCPKCNVGYCSISCFQCKAHMKCSENFYEQLVKQELQGKGTSPEAKKKMLEILQRTNQEPDSPPDSDDEEDLEERIKGINFNDPEALWNCLLKEEQDEFMDFAKCGDVESILPSWVPWWYGSAPVVELTSKNKDQAPFQERCPKIVKVPKLSLIVKAKPAKTIPFNIINVIAAYASVTRIFNGDHQDSCVDATEALLCLAPVLSQNANYESAQIAVTVSKTQMETYSWLQQGEKFHDLVREDVHEILCGPSKAFPNYYINAALSDVHKILTACKLSLSIRKNELKKDGKFATAVSTLGEVPKQLVSISLAKLNVKKIEYYLSYMKQNPNCFSLL